jgi:hypothetical protein
MKEYCSVVDVIYSGCLHDASEKLPGKIVQHYVEKQQKSLRKWVVATGQGD